MEQVVKFIPIVLLLISAVSWVLVTPKQVKQLTAEQQVLILKEKILELFLLAEKQDWTGKEKMEWAIEKLKDSPYVGLLEMVTGKSVEDFLQEVYDNFMDRLAEVALHLDTNKQFELEESINE